MKRIFITGGHFMPALATITELINRGGPPAGEASWEIYYLGRRFGMEDDQAEALEYQEIKKNSQVHYLVINAGRIQPRFFVNVFQSIKSLFKIFIGMGQSVYWLLKIRPDIILSFGGYIAVPVVFWGWLLGIPIITHEQTVISGKANKLISHFADKILLSWEESRIHFPQAKSVLTGNPLRTEIKDQLDKKISPGKLPKILVTGGNQGSHAINLAVEEIISSLSKKYFVIHQTGDSQFQDFARLQKFAGPNYLVQKFFTSQEMAKHMFEADLIVCRSGANTVTEILALGKPAVFIPIPWSKNQEQLKNAQMVKKIGLGEILSQKELTGNSLSSIIDKMMKNLAAYTQNIPQGRELIVDNAAEKIVDEIVKLVTK